MARCLDENTALELIDSKLSSAQRSAIERHLEGCDACRELVAELAKVDPITSPKAKSVFHDESGVDTVRTPPVEGGSAVRPASRLGHYRVESEVGSGSAGTVYRAVDERTNRVVALKLVTDEGFRTRFAREAQTLARLDHDAIVRYLEHGEAPSGMFLAMEWLEGEDLAKRLERGRVGWQGARTLGLRLSAALAHAHGLGCVHRDLSPRNVFLPNGRLELAKLLDFGLVRIPDTQLAQTATGAVLGTPFYMSPEQIRDPKSVTARSDLFGLGVLLYEMISGVRPFQGDDLFTLWVRIVDQPAADLRMFAGAVPEAFVALVESLLAKDPAHRPSSAAEVHHRLTTMSFDLAASATFSSSSTPTAPPRASPSLPLGASGSISAIPPVVPRLPVPVRPAKNGAAIAIGAAIVGAIVIAGGSAVAYRQLGRPTTSKTTSGSAPTTAKRFPLACDTNEELDLSGDWQGAGPILTSVGDNCKVRIKGSKLKGTSLISTTASNVELTLEDVIIETTDTAITSGTNLNVKVLRSTITSSANVLNAGSNLEVSQLEGSTLQSNGGVAIRASGSTKLRMTSSKILARDGAIDTHGSIDLHFRGASKIASRDGIAIKSSAGSTFDVEGGQIEGVGGIVATSNAKIDARSLTLTGAREPAVRVGAGAEISFTNGTISSRNDAAISVDNAEIALVGAQVQGETGISAHNGLKLRAVSKTRILASSSSGVVLTSNGEITLDDSVIDAGALGIKGTVNGTIRLVQSSRVSGKRGGIELDSNSNVDGNQATVDGGAGPGISASTNARISFRSGTLKGTPAFRSSSKPLSLDLDGTRIEGGQKIGR